MSGESGKAEISHGVHYEEHQGVKAELMFGQELLFVAGSEMSVCAGLESAVVLGAETKVGIATNTILELGAEVKYIRGLALEIAHEGGGAYEHAFTATAGSSSLAAFTRLNWFMGIAVTTQVAAVAAILIVTRTSYVQDGKLQPHGESGVKTTLAVCQNTIGSLMVVFTLAMNTVLKKFFHVEPLAAMTVNHESQAFIGVRGSATHAGTGGLELTPNQFKLSAGNKNRDFRTSGHEVVGYEADKQGALVKTDPTTVIEGTDDLLTIEAKQVKLSATSTPGSIVFNQNKMHAWVAGNAANPGTSLQMGNVSLTAPGGAAAAAVQGIRLGVSSAGTAVSMAENWVRVSCDDGSMLEIQKGSQVKLSYANSSASVLLTQTAASLNFGTQSVKMSTTGVDLAGVITVLAPAPGLPDAKSIVTVNSEVLATIASNMKEQIQSVAQEQAGNAFKEVYKNLSDIKRKIETKVSEALTKAGRA